MSCKAELTSTKICWSTDSCVVCRDDGKTQRAVNLTPGFEYTECMPVTWVDGDDCTAVTPMVRADDPIAGIVTCYQNLVDAADGDVCPARILCGAMFDVKMINWPEGITIEDIACIMTRSDKPCFTSREGCVPLPDFYQTGESA